jgi:nicotinate-nucleotide adenylyltransferase
MKNLGVMGGAFSPIHFRHLMVAQAAYDQAKLDSVVFVPSGQPPHKKELLDKEARFAMVQVAIADNAAFQVSRLEVDAPGPSWTIDTFKALIAAHGGSDKVRLSFVIGEDNLPPLRDYDRRAEFLSLCRLLVSPRASKDAAGLLKHWQAELPEAEIVILDVPADEASSTTVRSWIKAGRCVRYLIPEVVYALIKKNGYYGYSGSST